MEGWLFQVKRYFEIHGVPPEQRLTIVAFYMQGEALKWFQWLHLTHQNDSWPTFVRDISARFGPSSFWNAEVALNKLQQTTTVAAYITEFESLSARIPGLSVDNLLYRFLAGLKDEIHREIVLMQPQSLQAAMGMVRVIEDKITATRNFTSRPWIPKPTTHNYIHNPAPQKPQPTLIHQPARKLTATEMSARRAKGLCYNCDERWVPGHPWKARFQCYIADELAEITEIHDEENTHELTPLVHSQNQPSLQMKPHQLYPSTRSRVKLHEVHYG